MGEVCLKVDMELSSTVLRSDLHATCQTRMLGRSSEEDSLAGKADQRSRDNQIRKETVTLVAVLRTQQLQQCNA